MGGHQTHPPDGHNGKLSDSQHAFHISSRSSDFLNYVRKKTIKDLHDSQVRAYQDAAKRALTDYAQNLELPPVEENETENLYIIRIVKSLVIPDWKVAASLIEACCLQPIRSRASLEYQRQDEEDGEGEEDDDEEGEEDETEEVEDGEEDEAENDEEAGKSSKMDEDEPTKQQKANGKQQPQQQLASTKRNPVKKKVQRGGKTPAVRKRKNVKNTVGGNQQQQQQQQQRNAKGRKPNLRSRRGRGGASNKQN